VTRTVRVPRPAGELNQRLAVPLDLELAPGVYRMAVGLRDVHSGEASFVVTEVERP
jgi:hypothetical protein